MTSDDLNADNVGRKVVIAALGPYENCKATFRAWQKNRTTVLCSLDADYGVTRRKGNLVEVSIENASFAPTDRVTPEPGLASK
jgi:hypothetical protein